jgi:HD-GYP domain-containing protein (c-di-GMP phosphodiesterase class II)
MTDHESNTCVDQAGEQSAPAMMIPVALETFRKSMLNCDIYVRQGPDNALTLYRKKSHALDSADLDRLVKRGIDELYVSYEDQEAHRCGMAREISQDTTRPPSERYNLLREIHKASFEAAYHSGDVEQVVGVVNELGVQLVEVLGDNDIVLGELFSLMDHDDDTYSHSVNVATYSMLLAKYLGINDEKHLCSVMIGGLFHDLGKRHVDLRVLHKPGKLNSDERRQVEQHPTLGFKDLLPRGELTWAQLMMVYQHHERYDGKGYPVGLPGCEIHDLAKVTMIADVFHALTSVRPYRQPKPTDQACGFLTDQSGKMFDPEMTRCWNSKMKAGVCV